MRNNKNNKKCKWHSTSEKCYPVSCNDSDKTQFYIANFSDINDNGEQFILKHVNSAEKDLKGKR